MHELAITQSILSLSLKAAEERGASKIRAIRLSIGPFSGVIPECVQMYLDVRISSARPAAASAWSGCPDGNVQWKVWRSTKRWKFRYCIR